MPRQRGRSEDETCGVTAFVFRVEQPIYTHILTVHCVFTDELLGMSTSSMDFDVSSVEGESHLQSYMQVQQVLTVPVTSVSPERFFGRVALVQTDLCGRLLDTTMIDLMWDKQSP